MKEISNFAEMLENEIKNNLKVRIKSDYGGYVEVNLLYKGEVIDSDVCQVITDFDPLEA